MSDNTKHIEYPYIRYATTNKNSGYVVVRCVPREIKPIGNTLPSENKEYIKVENKKTCD